MGTVGPTTQVLRLWKIISSPEKLEKGSGGETFPSDPTPGGVTSHTLSPSVI